MSCVFCKIVSGEIPGAKIYEDEKTLAFLDVSPLTLGHTLIVPKGHAENILEVPNEDIGDVFLAVKHVAQMLVNTFGRGGFTIGINQGRISGQVVDHLHIHVIPRYSDDGGGSLHSVVSKPPDESVEETKKRILEANK